ncbi:hypothetical protein B4N89_35300 [Embleya scabrispora]|uniref:Secreted protein n=1 Tax=Embleya scabrispora TaxID=159449 RepID=A0A1T3NRI6_9ACTN|nr:hypothetical protein [Embleya scabrispora]OPC79320.1 hypothetical protein B4N89_35300 [Embleya scabrispora]
MKKRIGLLAAATVATLVPLAAATSASAAGEFHVSGVYYTTAQCHAAGVAGYNLWGPSFFCSDGPGGLVYLYTH